MWYIFVCLNTLLCYFPSQVTGEKHLLFQKCPFSRSRGEGWQRVRFNALKIVFFVTETVIKLKEKGRESESKDGRGRLLQMPQVSRSQVISTKNDLSHICEQKLKFQKNIFTFSQTAKVNPFTSLTFHSKLVVSKCLL